MLLHKVKGKLNILCNYESTEKEIKRNSRGIFILHVTSVVTNVELIIVYS